MRYILITTQGKEHVDAWLNGSAEDKEAEIEATGPGSGSTGWPAGSPAARSSRGRDPRRPSGRRASRDGPFAETKEQIGGFIVVEVASEAEAIAMAQGWPGLAWEGDAVEVRPARLVGGRGGRAARGRIGGFGLRPRGNRATDHRGDHLAGSAAAQHPVGGSARRRTDCD